MSSPTILPLFSTPVYISNVGDFSVPDVRALEYTTAAGYHFLSSADRNVLARPEFEHVHEIVRSEIERYARQVLSVGDRIQFYVTNSWINIHRRGQFAGPHAHGNSLLSGVLYLKAPEDGGAIVFHRDVNSLVPFPPTLDLDMTSFNIYNAKSWGHAPRTNDICLFPSVVMHSVLPSQSDEERWSLAFNVFVRGEIGTDHKLNLG